MNAKEPFDRKQVPKPIFNENPDYIELYWKAWELAWDHVYERMDTPARRYMDEALNPNVIWIWDSCFMVLYCRYAPHYFPGIETLNNFYIPLHEGLKIPIKIQHVDNPPLFAWVEYEYFKYTGDLDRIKWVLIEKQFLQKHFELIENMKRFKRINVSRVPTFAKKLEFGFRWSGTPSGMDNTPRGRGSFGKIYWMDLLAQQGLAADNIIKLARILKREDIVKKYEKKYDMIKHLLNQYYWNEEEGIYYDILRKNPLEQVRVKTPATYWAMLSAITDPNQAAKLAQKADDPYIFGGPIPYPSVSRDDKDFEPRGRYWRGGIWLPMAYLATKALEKYGFFDIANRNAENLINHMVKTYKEYKPATIWEVYSPTEAKPATYKKNRNVFRPNFCGWSALGPISMLIENILGFYDVNATEKCIKWNLYRKKTHGIKRLRFGEIITNIIYDAGRIKINTNKAFTLIINGKEFRIKKGESTEFKYN
ncbi:MAG: MGH1-like glycoside hydrolase domain-containing protein [Promethearchaeota archaeon]